MISLFIRKFLFKLIKCVGLKIVVICSSACINCSLVETTGKLIFDGKNCIVSDIVFVGQNILYIYNDP